MITWLENNMVASISLVFTRYMLQTDNATWAVVGCHQMAFYTDQPAFKWACLI